VSRPGGAVSAPARIPLSAPVLRGNEAAYLQACIDENWVATSGRFTRELERAFADMHGLENALATQSGTAALHIALAELGIGPGDEVIIPDLTFVATANPVRYVGAEPVLADVERDTYGLDPAVLPGLITARTKAIIVVHLFGLPADMEGILAVAAQHGLPVIEDATESLGSTYDGRYTGTLGDIGCFSFNGNKVITSGGGGMVIARDEDRLAHMRLLAFQARTPGKGALDYFHAEVGFNYGMTNIQAAVGLAQFERLDEYVGARQAVAARYAERLADVPGLTLAPMLERATWNGWLSSVLVDEAAYGESRDALTQRCLDALIEVRPFFTPMHELPPYAASARGALPVSTELHNVGLNLPSSADLSEADQERVLAVLCRD